MRRTSPDPAAAARGLRSAALGLALAFAGGCATLPNPLGANLESDSATVRSCADWFRTLDGQVERAGVRDASAYRIPGFPYLRTDRFLASFRAEATADDDKYRAWVSRLRELDTAARDFEVRNLPDAELRGLGTADRRHALARTAECSGELAQRDLPDPAARALLGDRSGVPDDYSDWQRAVGLYGITRIPFARGVERWHDEARAMFQRARDPSAASGKFQRFAPQAAPAAGGEIAAILRRAVPDALGVPRFTEADANRLLAAYAPLLDIETNGASDRFGALVWRATAPEVDAATPVVYQRLAYTRAGERTLVQLVYTAWFPERPRDGALDILAGRLDGVVLRVTLAPDGTPLVYDSIHPCGCYHMFFPTPLAQPVAAADPSEEWAFVPATLPAVAAGGRVAVRIASRTHYLLDIAPAGNESVSGSYALADENRLRSLAVGDGSRRSLYGPDGLVPGTERGERMLFWPMGIPSAGAMRQWGRHATAFLGRRHFDDADLIARRFLIVPGERSVSAVADSEAGPAGAPVTDADSSSPDLSR